jgi:hypothetical protein
MGSLRIHSYTFRSRTETIGLLTTRNRARQSKEPYNINWYKELGTWPWYNQPSTTMRILIFGGFDGCTQRGADAAKWLKST